MKRLQLLFILLLFVPLATIAQSSFTQRLRKQTAGNGKVVIVQDTLIDHVVNNTMPSRKSTGVGKTTSSQSHDTSKTASKSTTNSETKRTDHEKDNAHRQEHEDEDATKTDAEATTTHIARQRYRAMGYRIQIFTGSNSHQDKIKAYNIGEKCQHLFPMLSVYPRFVSPRWTCRVGDFRTHEDAQTYARKIRAARITSEVRIVRCEVLLAK